MQIGGWHVQGAGGMCKVQVEGRKFKRLDSRAGLQQLQQQWSTGKQAGDPATHP